MSPLVVARYTQKTLSHFLLNTRGLSRVQTLLSPFQKNGENEDITTGRKDELDRTAKTEGVSTGRNAVGMCCVLPLASS